MPIVLGLAVVAVSAADPVLAQSPATPRAPMTAMPGHSAATGGASATSSDAADSSPLMKAMDNMNKGMAAAPATGNTEQDFVAMMIPHHQGAIDMAQVELNSGKDPILRKLARNIIAAQQREIAEMKAWQAKHPAKR